MNNNDKISQWVGKYCTCEHGFEMDNLTGMLYPTKYWGNCAMHGLGGLSIPWETSERRAIELFPLLLDRGFIPALFVAHTAPNKWQCDIAKSSDYDAVARGIQPDIAGAICAAMVQLIESI